MARNLHREPEFSVLGLVPVEKNIGVTAAALQLGVAVVHLSARQATLIDCNTSAPGWNSKSARGSRKDLDEEVCPGVSIVGRRSPTPGIDFTWCETAINARRARGQFVMCDLTGLAQTGALGRLLPHLDGVVSVVKSGATFEWRLTALHRQIPKRLDRGVLFLDA